MKRIAAILLGFMLGSIGSAIGAGVIGPMYMDKATGKAFPSQLGGVGSAGKVLRLVSATNATWQTLTPADIGALPSFYYAVTIPSTAGDAVDVATITGFGKALVLQIGMSHPDSAALAAAKEYVVPIYTNSTSGNWHQLYARSKTVIHSQEFVQLDLNVTAGTAVLRVRNTVSTSFGTAYITISVIGNSTTTTVAGSSATYTGATVSGLYAETAFGSINRSMYVQTGLVAGTTGTYAGSVQLMGSTSGSITQKAPAAATQCAAGQALRFSDGVGTVECYTPTSGSGSGPSTFVFPNVTKISTNTLTVTETDIATSTPTANKIPIADGSGNLNTWITNTVHTTDTRLSNARTPTAHASTHVSTGSDPIALVTVDGPGAVSGLMRPADKTKLDGIATGATNIVISAGTPVGAGFAAAAAGNSTQASASNHRHPDTIDVSVGGFYPQACSISTGNSIIAFPLVFWDRMPSALAAFVTVSVFNPNSGTPTSCVISAYSGSNEVQTLGTTYMGGGTLSSIGPGLHSQVYWTYAFTKPTGTPGIHSVIHFYGYCGAGGYLDSAHVHITAGS
jgi:hypothetical protein